VRSLSSLPLYRFDHAGFHAGQWKDRKWGLWDSLIRGTRRRTLPVGAKQLTETEIVGEAVPKSSRCLEGCGPPTTRACCGLWLKAARERLNGTYWGAKPVWGTARCPLDLHVAFFCAKIIPLDTVLPFTCKVLRDTREEPSTCVKKVMRCECQRYKLT